MTRKLENTVNWAKAMFASSPGFVSCAVRSDAPPILEFKFATKLAAERFKVHLELHSPDSGFRHQIDPRNPAVVLQYR